ncbi:MAG: 3-isopropylmalate dehydratase [Candidatus Moranbacteria bacterium]|nr:3-isopropylmalate dehydratase [Candidatus Moranbacteria bacterium]
MQANIHVYPKDSINTDEIIPARYLNSDQESELAKHALEDLDPNFIKKVGAGDFIIAGHDFGSGSSREHAIWALRGAGIQGVIAKSFARIFYRNAINNGFYAIECPGLDQKLKTGIKIDLNLDQGFFTAGKKKYSFTPIPDFVKDIMQKGGLLKTIQ